MIPLSYSRLNTFDTCPRRFLLEYIALNRPSSSELQNSFGREGSEKHKELELYLTSDAALPDWVPVEFRERIISLKTEGFASEQEMAFTVDWKPCAWDDPDAAWRVKIDASKVILPVAQVKDFKTGKIKMSHWLAQLEIYAIAMFLTYPEVEVVEAELWYLFHNHRSFATFYRGGLKRLMAKYDGKRAKIEAKVADADPNKAFPKQPSGLCEYCFFHITNNGPCNGVIDES